MSDLTVMEWCEENTKSEREVNFIYDFITFSSTAKYGNDSRQIAMQKIKQVYPEYEIDMDVKGYTFSKVDGFFKKYLGEDFDTRTMLEKFSKQGICKPLADDILSKP